MAASLREGAIGSFSTSLKTEAVARLGREDARRLAKAEHARLHSAGETFTLPSPSTISPDFSQLLSEHSTVGIYAGRASWFEVEQIETWLRSVAPTVLTTTFPRSNPDSFDFCAAAFTELVVSKPFGLYEPSASAAIAEPSLIFVPCTLADHSGHRMGRGKGHFDRYLARHPGIFAVGVCHEDFLLEQFPATWTEPHDQDMSALLTNTRFLNILNKGDRKL
ncbi:MAG: 5-formyltetrahydrofolate cyclo-ligase [Bdellovibrionota bacterium]